MPLDQLARRYADGLFSQAVDRITLECEEKARRLKGQLFQRGLAAHQILAQTYLEIEPFRAEALMRALGESLWSAYEAAGLQIGEFEFGEIGHEIKLGCETRKSSLRDELQRLFMRTGRSNDSQLYALTDRLVRECDISFSRVVREIRLKLDAQVLAARRLEPASDQKLAKYDVFISYAGPDWDPFARPLKEALEREKLQVWAAPTEIKIGDSLRRMIDRGISRSRFAAVILSKDFFARKWPQEELDGLGAMETPHRKVILPIWYKLTEDEVRSIRQPSQAEKLPSLNMD